MDGCLIQPLMMDICAGDIYVFKCHFYDSIIDINLLLGIFYVYNYALPYPAYADVLD